MAKLIIIVHYGGGGTQGLTLGPFYKPSMPDFPNLSYFSTSEIPTLLIDLGSVSRKSR